MGAATWREPQHRDIVDHLIHGARAVLDARELVLALAKRIDAW